MWRLPTEVPIPDDPQCAALGHLIQEVLAALNSGKTAYTAIDEATGLAVILIYAVPSHSTPVLDIALANRLAGTKAAQYWHTMGAPTNLGDTRVMPYGCHIQLVRSEERQ